MYTFDDQLTTDQKLAHLNEWIAASEAAVASTAPDGSRSNTEQHAEQKERLRFLEDWKHLIQVEEELALSKADLDDPDPLGDDLQEAWCRQVRVQLRVAGIEARIREEKSKRHPSPTRIVRLRKRIAALKERIAAVEEETESHAYGMIAQTFADFECEGAGCTADNPCPPCACRRHWRRSSRSATCREGRMRGVCARLPHPFRLQSHPLELAWRVVSARAPLHGGSGAPSWRAA